MKHTLAIQTDGSLWAWGENDVGQLGLGTTVEQHSPVRVGTLVGWSLVAAAAEGSGSHSLAIRTVGTLWAWGANNFGQLGIGTTDDQHLPQQIGADATWVAIAAGGHHSLARKSDHSLWGWGLNGSGAVGDSSNINRLSPVPITTP